MAVDVLDLNITIEDGKFITNVYDKLSVTNLIF